MKQEINRGVDIRREREKVAHCLAVISQDIKNERVR